MQKQRLAVMKDAPTMQRKEEFVGGTVHQRKRTRLAVTKDAPIRYGVEEFV